MAGHEWEDWFEREEFIGQISDIRVQNLQVEREVVQKRTFTRWMNLHLEKCNPPMEVKDLFRDIQDGQILMALLEELSGCKLLHGFKKSSHRIFRLNNIAKVLTFLEERNVKLVSIDAADVADGNSSIVLGLIWNIILFFQIKELTGNIKSQFPSCSSLSSIPTSSDSDTSHSTTPSEEKRPSTAMRDHGKAIKTLLQWVQRRTRKYGVAVQDFGKSWTSGLAFLAVIKSIDSSLVDMRRSLLRTAKENLEDAFRTAHYSLGIPRLLEPEDVTINPPDEQSIMTYVSQFLEHFPGIEEPQVVSEVIERSVSMGRLSSRNSDSELVRNGVHRSRQHERPYVVRKDWVQPPPKIFISSVSEDKEALSPTSPTSGNNPWASKDSSVVSTPSPSRDPQDRRGEREVFTICTSNSPQPSYVDSVIDSSAAESVIGDSAIGSPDSWAENEAATLDRSVDGSLCDSGVAWDANITPTTPEEIMLDEVLLSSGTGKPHDEQTAPELFINEGIYSLSSVDSTLERANDSSKEHEREDEENMYCYNLDLNENGAAEHVPDQKQTLNKTEDSEQRDISMGQSNRASSEKLPFLELSDIPQQSEHEGTCQSQHSSDQVTPEAFEQTEERGSAEESTDRNPECVDVVIEFSRDPQEINLEKLFPWQLSDNLGQSDGPGEVEVEIVSVTKQRTSSLSEREREEERLKQVSDERQDVTEGSEAPGMILQDVPNGQIWTSQAKPSEPGLDQEENYTGYYTESETPALAESVNSQVFALCDPPEGGEERPRMPELPVEEENDIHNVEVTEVIQDSTEVDHSVGDPHTHLPTTHTLHHPLLSDNGQEARNNTCQPNADQDRVDVTTVEDRKIPDTEQKEFTPTDISIADNEVGAIQNTFSSEPMDLFYSDTDRSSPLGEPMSESLEPMDLFYPDTDEAMLPNLHERKETTFSSFSVSVLQPAPSSEPSPDSHMHCLKKSQSLTETHPQDQVGDDVELEDDSDRREDRTLHEQEKVAEKTPGGWHVLEELETLTDLSVEHSDLTKTDEEKLAAARENLESVRSEGESDGAVKESTDLEGLHHRKVADSDQLKDNQKWMTASLSQNTNSKTSGTEVKNPAAECLMTVSELYFLLILWLLLYCLLVLQQMDIRSLPSLLLNLED